MRTEDLPLPRRQAPAYGLLAGVLLGFLALGALLVNTAGEILEAVSGGNGVALWDRPVLDWAIQQRTPPLTTVLLVYTHIGGTFWQPILVGALAVFLWWRCRDPTPFVLIAIAQVGALAVILAAKRAVNRARPPISDAVPPYETSASFPSGHTLQAFVVAGIVAYIVLRRLWDGPRWQSLLVVIVAGAYATLMAFSRVFLGYHWVTDVMAAAALGLAWTLVVIGAHRVWRTVRRRADPPPEPHT